MSTTANTAIDAGTSRDGSQDASPDNTIPRDCDPSRHLDWRFRYASHLVRNSSQRPITHEDPWIQAAVDFCVAHKSGWEDREPTIVDVSIATALELRQEDSLAKHLLEARLIAQEQPQEIYERCHLSQLTICAYLMLLFDVRGRDRKAIWFSHPRPTGKIESAEVWHFGFALKQFACFHTSEELNDHIDVLCSLDGKTMADGLPDRATAALGQELASRQALAKSLLPDNRPTKELLQRFDEAVVGDLLAGRSSSESIDLAIEILRKAKIPAELRKEIRRVRELCSQAAALATAEPPGTAAGVDN
ncbi:MAG: hypothetical protein HQ567_23350 [Candidatus Nealsonbacteria bacterium]|nr:hypothetical protein [Candidatus Nealsonbacteria bacterium]